VSKCIGVLELNGVTWCMRGGALNVNLIKTNKDEHNAQYVQY